MTVLRLLPLILRTNDQMRRKSLGLNVIRSTSFQDVDLTETAQSASILEDDRSEAKSSSTEEADEDAEDSEEEDEVEDEGEI